MSNYIYLAPTSDGFMNLARDGFFLENVEKNDIILYLYVNENAVIIGRNQNAWKECNLANMEDDGVQLVRRHTGGGAVYHDMGNLNFSFIMNEKNYDLDRQMKVITNAVSKLGLKCELSGRNDVLVEGKKFSGNAYGLAKGNRAHHGTVLVNAKLWKLANYLNVSQAKIKAKGIDSVRSRVCNLSDFVEGLTVEEVRKLVIDSFIEEYGSAEEYRFSEIGLADVANRCEVHKSWEWRLGKTPEFDYVIDNRFSFGEMQFHFSLKEGCINEVKVFSDCLDTELTGELEENLKGCRFESSAIKLELQRMKNQAVANEISDFIIKLHKN